MPWEKQFDVDGALCQALGLFWSNGYEATSVSDLLEQMGINRGSFYDTFTDKRKLFVATLQRYESAVVGPVIQRAAAASDPVKGILSVFETALKDALSEEGSRGCFLTNTALELASKDPEIAQMVRAGFHQIETFFHQRLNEAKQHNLVSAGLDARRVSAALVALLIGIRVMARARAEEPVLKAVVSQAAALLGR